MPRKPRATVDKDKTPPLPLATPVRKSSRPKKKKILEEPQENVEETTTITTVQPVVVAAEQPAQQTQLAIVPSSQPTENVTPTTMTTATDPTTTTTTPKKTRAKKPSITAQKSKQYHTKAKECKYRFCELVLGDFIVTLGAKDYYGNISLEHLEKNADGTTKLNKYEITAGTQVKMHGHNNTFTVWGISVPSVGQRATLYIQDEGRISGDPQKVSHLDIVDIIPKDNWNSSARDAWFAELRAYWRLQKEQKTLVTAPPKGKKVVPQKQQQPQSSPVKVYNAPKAAQNNDSILLLQTQLLDMQRLQMEMLKELKAQRETKEHAPDTSSGNMMLQVLDRVCKVPPK